MRQLAMPAVLGIDLWPFPDIPGPEDWFKSIAKMFTDAQLGAMKQSIELLLHHSAPSYDMVQSDWFRFILGSWMSVAQRTISLMIIVVALMVQVNAMSDHSRKLGRLGTSIAGVILTVWMFYPVYQLISTARTMVSQAIIDKFVNGGDVASMMTVLKPTSIVGLLVSSMVGSVVFCGVAAVAVGLNVVALTTLSFYPMAWACRPLPFGERFFHLCNGALVMTILSGPVMIFWLAMGYKVSMLANQTPIGGEVFVSIVVQDVTGLLAMLSPIVIFVLARKKSGEVFGKIDASVQGAVRIASSNPVDVRVMKDDKPITVKGLATSAVVATMDDKRGEPVSRRLADVAATAATASGHPEVAAAFQFVKKQIPDQNKPKGGGA